MNLGVVVPVLDEAARVSACLTSIAATLPRARVYVCDGGSSDATPQLVAAHPSRVTLLTAGPGRAAQMNVGAARALTDGASWLLFLHADTLLPPDAATWIQRTLADPEVVAGAFRTRTVADAPGPPWWAPLLRLADLRSRYSGLPYGDQAIFVKSAAFSAVGGYPDQPLMEDLELGRRLRRIGRIRTARGSVQVSGRRFVARPVFYTVLVNVYPVLYRAGVSPHTLHRFYAAIR
jgi:rSAM/selenodomain-associated transferase 2